MRDCITHQVQERIGNHIGERFLDANISALNFKLNVLSQMTSGDSAGAGGSALQNFAGGHQSQLDQSLFKGDESHAQVSGRRLGRLGRRRSANCGQRVGSLAGQFAGGGDQIVELRQFNTDGSVVSAVSCPREWVSGVARRLCFAGRHLDLDFMMRYVSKRRRAAQNFT